MWTLECEGPLFHHKRLWLKPGTSHLFGRSKQETLRNTESYVLEAKSVSKKHLKLSIAAVKPGHGSQLHSRTEVTIEEFSKLGTTIDGERISQATRVLKGDKHVFQVAKYEHFLILKWQPVTFTIVNLTRAEKQSTDPLANYRAKLEPHDIKFTQDYVTGLTTHVIVAKRNVAPALQGLIHGNYIVTKEYLDAVVRAATEEPPEDGQGEPKAPLEKDFDGSWPDAMEFVPPVAGEPTPREAAYLAPNEGRTDIFYGFAFVFCMKQQFESLQPVVNAGSGKALLYESFEEGVSSASDFAAFVKNVAGEKGPGELTDTSQNKGVVVVRVTATKDKGHEDWVREFVTESSLLLGQRTMEQNELLDMILTMDTAGLRKRLTEEIDLTATSRSARPTPAPQAPPKKVQPPKPEPRTQSKSQSARVKTESRFKGFDAFDDDSSDEEPTPKAPAAATRSMPQITEDVVMEGVEDAPASAPTRGTRLHPTNPRKRPTPEPSNGDFMDEILPATAAMKRRKLNEKGKAPAKQRTPEPVKPKAKPKREIDVMAEVEKRRNEEETRAAQEAENLKAAMDGMEIEGPANLAITEEMVLSRSHSASASRASRASSERWDPKWDGRPNFKRFRRKGEERPAGRRQRNFVPMEETKRRDFGIGDEYWLENSEKQKEKSQRESQAPMTQTMRQTQATGSDDEQDNTQFRRRTRTEKPSQATPVAEDEDEDDVEIVEETLRTSRGGSQASKEKEKEKPATRKRAAKDPPAKEPPSKRKAWRKAESDEEDEDELAFPRRRATRRRG